MWRRVYRQRRRLGIGFGLFMLIGMTSVPIRMPGDLAVALVGLPLGMTLVFALVIAFAPRWGLVVELLAGTMLVQQVLFALAPVLAWKVLEGGPLLRLGLWFFIYYVLINLGMALNGIQWPGALALTARRLIARPREQVWQALALEPGRPHWNPDIVRVGPPLKGVDGVELVPADPDGPVRPGTVERVLQAEPGRYRHSLRQYGSVAEEDPGTTTDERIRLGDHPRGTVVELIRTHRRMPLMTAVRLWLEDQTGDVLDDFAATVEGRANWSLSALRRQKRLRRVAAASA